MNMIELAKLAKLIQSLMLLKDETQRLSDDIFQKNMVEFGGMDQIQKQEFKTIRHFLEIHLNNEIEFQRNLLKTRILEMMECDDNE